MFFWLISKIGDALFQKAIALIPSKKARVGKRLLSVHRNLAELEQRLSWLLLALNMQARFLDGERPVLSSLELNPYARESAYFFEYEAGEDAVAGMTIKHRAWTRMADSDTFAPTFASADPYEVGGAISYEQFLRAFLDHTCLEVYGAIQRTANSLHALLALLQEGTLNVLDSDLYETLFRLDVADLYFGYWIAGHPPQITMRNAGEQLSIRTFEQELDLERLSPGRPLFEGVADVPSEFVEPQIYQVTSKASIVQAITVIEGFRVTTAEAGANVATFLRQHFSLDELL
jgi:hypothetical protein